MRAWNVAVILVPVVLTAILAWERRWITDDGLIVVRTVRELLAGNGPNFNPGERVEADTSALWTYLVAAGAWVTGVDPARVAVYLGLVGTVAGVALALDGTRRFHLASLSAARLVPVGVLVLLALPPFWDFSTSGLESGLDFAWMGLCWWLLVRVHRGAARTPPLLVAFVIGLGPLVRPEQLLTSIVLFAALWLLRRPSVLRGLGWIGAALALPLGYEVFRMGYYGLLVPNTALAKEAFGLDLNRGGHYMWDTVGPYALWVPALLLAALGAFALARRRTHAVADVPADAEPGAASADAASASESDAASGSVAAETGRRRLGGRTVLVGAAVASGVLQLAYVVAIGGDFMHGRMVLPGLFLLLLPVVVLRAAPAAVAVGGAVAVWALVCGFGLRVNEHGPASPYISASGISDERAFYTHYTHTANPVTAGPYLRANRALVDKIDAAAKGGSPVLIIEHSYGPDEVVSPLRPDGATRVAVVWDYLGTQAAALPVNGVAVDDFSLAYPLASHLALDERGRAGHEKQLPLVWVVADYRDPSALSADPAFQQQVAEARRALGCGDLAELQTAVRAPLTSGRFWDNLTGSFGRTFLRFPSDPAQAVRQFCGS